MLHSLSGEGDGLVQRSSPPVYWKFANAILKEPAYM